MNIKILSLYLVFLGVLPTRLYSQLRDLNYSAAAAIGYHKRLYKNPHDHFIIDDPYVFTVKGGIINDARTRLWGLQVYIHDFLDFDSSALFNSVQNDYSKLALYTSGYFQSTQFGPFFSAFYNKNKFSLAYTISCGPILTSKDGILINYPNGVSVLSDAGYDWGIYGMQDLALLYSPKKFIAFGLNYDAMFGNVWLNLGNHHGQINNIITTEYDINYIISTHALKLQVVVFFGKDDF